VIACIIAHGLAASQSHPHTHTHTHTHTHRTCHKRRDGCVCVCVSCARACVFLFPYDIFLYISLLHVSFFLFLQFGSDTVPHLVTSGMWYVCVSLVRVCILYVCVCLVTSAEWYVCVCLACVCVLYVCVCLSLSLGSISAISLRSNTIIDLLTSHFFFFGQRHNHSSWHQWQHVLERTWTNVLLFCD